MNLFKSRSFFKILSKSIKLLPKNAKLMSLVALFSTVLTSSAFLLFVYTFKSLLDDMSATFQKSFTPDPNLFDKPDPATPGFGLAQFTGPLRQLQEDFAILLAVETAFILVVFIISFFSSISTILISAASYKSKNSSLKELFSVFCRKWTSPLITTFYVSTLAVGYFFVFSMLACPLLAYRNNFTLSVAILTGIIALGFYLYLSVSWALAFVVSVIEGSFYGIEALGKAEALVKTTLSSCSKGKRLLGFLINVCLNVLVWIVLRGFKMILGGGKWLFEYPMVSGLFVVIFLALAGVFVAVTYTVLYFDCKELHGEEVELDGAVGYTKVQNMEFGSNDMA